MKTENKAQRTANSTYKRHCYKQTDMQKKS